MPHIPVGRRIFFTPDIGGRSRWGMLQTGPVNCMALSSTTSFFGR
jgi:hypothetical protein